MMQSPVSFNGTAVVVALLADLGSFENDMVAKLHPVANLQLHQILTCSYADLTTVYMNQDDTNMRFYYDLNTPNINL